MTATIHKFPVTAIKRIPQRPRATWQHMPVIPLCVRNGNILIRYLLGSHVKEKWVGAEEVQMREMKTVMEGKLPARFAENARPCDGEGQ